MLHLIGWLIIGGLAGWLAGKLVSGHGYGIVGDVLLGIVGAFVGGYIFRDLLHLVLVGSIGQFIVAFVGAVIIVAIVHVIRREPI
jgi:uncharacterized membrane protein YeaQ/YmgE (transglycosylase-associated protein family)